MIFSMFRPSDDACTYPLFIPANHFAVQTLIKLRKMAVDLFSDTGLAAAANEILTVLQPALAKYGMVEHPTHGRIWAYEVDGYGNALMMDDAGTPSLHSLPYLGSCEINDPAYQRTRRFIHSDANPYFVKGTAAEGVGSPHVSRDSVWPLSMIMRAFTTADDREVHQCLQWLRNTTDGTGFMHESFHRNDPTNFTRKWFAWANTQFGELLLQLADQKPALLNQRYGDA